MGLWGLQPEACPIDPDVGCHGAFRGLGLSPDLGDFVYLAVNVSLGNMPPDVIAASRWARTAVTIELVSGIALVAAHGARFLGLRVAIDETKK